MFLVDDKKKDNPFVIESFGIQEFHEQDVPVHLKEVFLWDD
jgi:hypothetical protein